MGIEDTTKTDARTETSDKPAPQERPTPPPDNPGSPGQPSRLESLRRAREQQEARAQETQDENTGTSPREQRDDKAASQQPGGREENADSGTPEAEDKQQGKDKDQREDDPRTQDQGTSAVRETDTGTPGDRNRDRPQTQPAEPRADTRTEPADRPASPQGQWTPPPDNPGSPGQPSRLESLARAREQQQAAAAQRSETTDTASGPTEQRDNQSPTPQPENNGVKAEPVGNAEGAGNEQDADTPTDDAKTEDRPKPDTSEAPPIPEHNLRDADKPTRDAYQQVAETADQPTDSQGPRPGTTTGELVPQERTTEPGRTNEQGTQKPDGSANDADQPRPESAEQSTPLADNADQSLATDTHQNTEATPSAPDTRTHADQPGDQPTTENGPSSPEEPNRDQETAEPLGQHDDRGKKAAEPETTEPGNENRVSDRAPRQSGEPEESGTELAPQEANTAEVEEANRFEGRIRIAFDSDGRPIPPSRDTENDTAGHGELRRPEDDPAERNPLEPDPERRRSPRDIRREMMKTGPDFQQSINEGAKPAFAQFDSQPPKTQPCVGRNVSSQIESSNLPIKAGDAVVGVVGGVILATELLRLGIGAIKR